MVSVAHINLETAKRSCNRCYSFKTFRQNDDEKNICQNALKAAKEELARLYNEIRTKEETTSKQLGDLKQGKNLCMDALEACESCDKSNPLVKQILMEIK